MCEKLLAENHRGHSCRNSQVAILESRACLVIFSKTQFEFWERILQQKNYIFPLWTYYL